MIQVREHGDSEHRGSGREDEKWYNSEYILKRQPKGFPNTLGVGCEKKRPIKENWGIQVMAKVFWLEYPILW